MIDPTEMRRVLGHYASGVVIVTAAGAAGPVGMTMQSFHALSLDPALVALFPARSSTTWPQLAPAGRLCVNVLAVGQAGLAQAFARRGENRFAGLDWQPDAGGAPMLAGALAHISCRITQTYDGGDHHIVVAAVEALSADPTAEPLVFYRGTFRALAAPI